MGWGLCQGVEVCSGSVGLEVIIKAKMIDNLRYWGSVGGWGVGLGGGGKACCVRKAIHQSQASKTMRLTDIFLYTLA